MRVCARCKRDLPLKRFYSRNGNPAAVCNQCNNAPRHSERKRTAKYEQIVLLHGDGLTATEIAERLRLGVGEVVHNLCWHFRYGRLNDEE